MGDEIRYAKPAVDAETRPWWEACGRGELVLQRCRACGSVQHRPRALCAGCLSGTIEWFRASGRGRVHTWTVTRQNQAQAFREAVPYLLAWVDLDEGPRLLANLVGVTPEQVRLGMPVQVEFVEVGDELGVPRFRPA
jgi:uncharacterized OB-fold protein